MNTKTELLAPAKNKETALAAIDCGADAVYIGAPSFGARQNASNSLDDIKDVVNYAHKFWAKVHVTVNTILTDSELDEAVKLIHKLYEIGVDAVIIQDFGLLEKLKDSERIPLIHMSTQCDNYNAEKIKFFNNIGVSRVVLARELTLNQINEIHEQNPELELESFIHGALCVSMSGQCYLSQYIGGRSANRGECAQPCRKKYDIIDKNKNIIAKDIYALCLKDFCAAEHINELINAGVCSFKIEGRLKDIGYVKNITAYYRNLIPNKTSSGKSFYSFTPDVYKTFNRGFTNYFLKNRSECYNFESPKSKGEYIGKVIKTDKSSFTVKTSKLLSPQDGLYFNGEGCLINKVINKNNCTEIFPNKPVKLTVGDKIFRNFDVKFEKELLKTVKRQIGVCINISGNNNSISLNITDEDGVSVEKVISCDNIANNPEKMKETFVKQMSKTGEGDFYIEDIKIAPDTVLPFMPVSEINALRRECFGKLMDRRLFIYNENRPNQKHIVYHKFYQSEVDYRANVHNNSAEKFYNKCGVKVNEKSFESNIPSRQTILMKCKHCIKYALNMCKSPNEIFLKDSDSKIYPLEFNCKECEMYVLKP